MSLVDSRVIIDYLKYLRDTSRRIGTRSSFENIFLKRNRKNNSYTIQVKVNLLLIIGTL